MKYYESQESFEKSTLNFNLFVQHNIQNYIKYPQSIH